MAEGKRVIILQLPAKAQQNDSDVTDGEIIFSNWIVKQSVAVEAAVHAADRAIDGAVFGAITGWLKVFPGGPLMNARRFGVCVGSRCGISSAMQRLRGKEDLLSRVVAGFGSGALFSLAGFSGGGPYQPIIPAMNAAVRWGLFWALTHCVAFQAREKPPLQRAEDVYYNKTRSLLNNLGLQKYEKNFKDGLFIYTTFPLLTDRALREVKIPPEP